MGYNLHADEVPHITTPLSPDEWASWILMGDPDIRWPVTLNELAKRIKEAVKIIEGEYT